MIKDLKELYAYRQMIFSLVKKDLRGRYKGSVLGFMWTFINPLLQMGVYTLVFSIILRNDIDKYYLFLFVALVPWIFFSASLTGGADSVLASKDMLKKIYFPREVLPISYVTGAFVNMLLSFVVIFGVIIFTGHGLNPLALLTLPIIMLVEYVMALGIALLSSALTVYFRDLSYILGIIAMAVTFIDYFWMKKELPSLKIYNAVLTAWLYLTPIMYSSDLVPDKLRPLWNLNPMTPVIEAYRSVLYAKQVPQLSTLIQAAVLGVIVCVIGYISFRKLQKGFAEEL